MYNVMIVDDEAPARELLKIKVDWESLDCQVAITAKNGKEALKLYKEQQPDLIITDIQMPVMNGLQLIEEIRTLNQRQPIIILSCHESFSFAKKAIQLGVSDYLIKDSFSNDDLYSIITNIFNENNDIGYSNPLSSKNHNDNKKSLVIRKILTTDLSESDIQGLMDQYDVTLLGPTYKLMTLELEIINQDVSHPESKYLIDSDIQLVLSIIRQALIEYTLGGTCHIEGNKFAIIYDISSRSHMTLRKEAITLANHLRNGINNRLRVQTNIGISKSFTGLENAKKYLEASTDAINKKIINGYDKTYFADEGSNINEEQYITILNVKLERIQNHLNNKDFNPIIKETKDIFLQNLNGFTQYNYIKHTNWTLLGILMEYCSKNSISFIELSGSRSPWDDIMNQKSVEDMSNWFIGHIRRIKENIIVEKISQYTYHVQNCVNYIDKHYGDNISLRDLADELDINNAYLSRIFKKEVGLSVTDYINKVRVEQAKSLIQQSHKKMYEIAELTGFNSTQRFFAIFKKFVGQSPGDYKKQ